MTGVGDAGAYIDVLRVAISDLAEPRGVAFAIAEPEKCRVFAGCWVLQLQLRCRKSVRSEPRTSLGAVKTAGFWGSLAPREGCGGVPLGRHGPVLLVLGPRRLAWRVMGLP